MILWGFNSFAVFEHRHPAKQNQEQGEPAPGFAWKGLLPAHLAFLLFDHALDHVAADVTGLAGGQIAVVALLEVDAQLAGDFVLHVVQSGAGFGHVGAVGVTGIAGRGTVIGIEHGYSLLFHDIIGIVRMIHGTKSIET